MSENSQKLLPVLVPNFGESSAFQYCTVLSLVTFWGSEIDRTSVHTKPRSGSRLQLTRTPQRSESGARFEALRGELQARGSRIQMPLPQSQEHASLARSCLQVLVVKTVLIHA